MWVVFSSAVKPVLVVWTTPQIHAANSTHPAKTSPNIVAHFNDTIRPLFVEPKTRKSICKQYMPAVVLSSNFRMKLQPPYRKRAMAEYLYTVF